MPDEHEKLARDMTVRESFAQAAMSGLLADSETEWTPEGLAAEAALHADALLTALNGNTD